MMNSASKQFQNNTSIIDKMNAATAKSIASTKIFKF